MAFFRLPDVVPDIILIVSIVVFVVGECSLLINQKFRVKRFYKTHFGEWKKTAFNCKNMAMGFMNHWG